jgi:hypothetical protein
MTKASPLTRQFNKSVDVQRLSPITDTNKEQYAAHLTGVCCMIQPLDDVFSEDLQGSFGKNYILFCEVQDILEGDRIVDGSINYKVVGVEKFTDFLDRDDHMELTIREFTD